MQNPCFLEFTDRVALQNPQNKGVPCKIVQDKELRDVLASADRFRLTGDTKGRAGTMICRKSSEIIVRRSGEIICKGLAVQADALRAMRFVESQVPKCEGPGALSKGLLESFIVLWS
jgi:hypothetical protein